LEGDGIQRKRKRGWVGSYGNIWDVIQGFEFLKAKLEEYKAVAVDYSDAEHFRININLGWQKLNKYYTILDETPIYYVALALHPAYRWGWFEEHWGKHPDWIATAKEMVQEEVPKCLRGILRTVTIRAIKPVIDAYDHASEDEVFCDS
ncbi:hypothetical protein BFJ63_vAg20416, partial [Fusarium oxysporum f. sp. narcissi]